ncbi:MAG: glycosyltransferase family 2 protein [Planctomycetota bacterium]
MKAHIVIVNYRTADLTIDCLRTLATEAEACGATCTVVDGASGDDSVERLTPVIDALPWCDFLPLDTNGGFAFGNNRGIEHAFKHFAPDAIWLLNPDTRVRPGALRHLIDFLDAKPHCGIAGGNSLHEDETPMCCAFGFPTVLGEIENTLRVGLVTKLLNHRRISGTIYDKSTAVGWVAGASMLVRREVFDAIGLLDEGFFMYYEEVDFCRRALDHGWTTWHVPASEIIHLVGASSGVTGAQRAKKRRPRYWFDSRRRYFLRHLGRARTAVVNVAWLASTPLARFVDVLRRNPRNDPPRLWRDFAKYNLTADLTGR